MPYNSSFVTMPAEKMGWGSISAQPSARNNAIPLTQLLPKGSKLVEIGLILPGVLDLLLDTFKDPDGGRVVVQPPCCLERALDDGRSWDEIVCEAIVQAPLKLECVFD